MSQDLQRITAIVCEVGKISGINPDDDIYDAGFSSINALQLLMELESALEVSIPDDEFIQARSPRALLAVIERLKQEQLVS
jgi:acyl carrier protein